MPQKVALEMVMYTCPGRRNTLAATMHSLARSDWASEFRLIVDASPNELPPLTRMAVTFLRAMHQASESSAAYVVVAEDDILFNRHFEHNAKQWLSSDRFDGTLLVGSFYRSNIGRSIGNQALVARPFVWRTLYTAARLLDVKTFQPTDGWLRRRMAVWQHSPSLVQHNATTSTCGHPDHRARDFDPEWRA